jgi:hypothetical protein
LDCVYTDADEATGRGILITTDALIVGGRFLDALTPRTPDEVAESLEQLAILHAHSWNVEKLTGSRWFTSLVPMYLAARGRDVIEANFTKSWSSDVPDAARSPERLQAAIVAISRRTADARLIIHGDAHIGNLIVDAQGRPGFVDWQCTQVGEWGIDVGYHIASALTTEVREQHECALLRTYLECLDAHGIDPPDWDTAWAQYRRGIVYGFYMWAITLHVDPAITAVLLQRLGAAVAAHDCLSVEVD